MQTPDLTGQRFGRLVVEVMDIYQGKASTICKCDCGNSKRVRAHDLKRGFLVSCGCWKRHQIGARSRKDLTGQRFGRLLVEAMEWYNQSGYALCRCECGQITRVLGQHLTSGHTQSCGCFFREQSKKRTMALRKDLTGMQFGRLRVQAMEWRQGKGYAICDCDCGTGGLSVNTSSLLRGQARCYSCNHRTTSEEKYVTKRLTVHRRLARVRGLPSHFTRESETFLRAYWGDVCAICGAAADFWHRIAWDHWIPLSHPACPGTVPDNILPLCHSRKGAGTLPGSRSCNNSKFKRDPVVWLTQKLGVRKAKVKLREIEAYFAEARARASTVAYEVA